MVATKPLSIYREHPRPQLLAASARAIKTTSLTDSIITYLAQPLRLCTPPGILPRTASTNSLEDPLKLTVMQAPILEALSSSNVLANRAIGASAGSSTHLPVITSLLTNASVDLIATLARALGLAYIRKTPRNPLLPTEPLGSASTARSQSSSQAHPSLLGFAVASPAGHRPLGARGICLSAGISGIVAS